MDHAARRREQRFDRARWRAFADPRQPAFTGQCLGGFARAGNGARAVLVIAGPRDLPSGPITQRRNSIVSAPVSAAANVESAASNT